VVTSSGSTGGSRRKFLDVTSTLHLQTTPHQNLQRENKSNAAGIICRDKIPTEHHVLSPLKPIHWVSSGTGVDETTRGCILWCFRILSLDISRIVMLGFL
jgi:hypothetical protein